MVKTIFYFFFLITVSSCSKQMGAALVGDVKDRSNKTEVFSEMTQGEGTHPSLILTRAGVREVRSNLGTVQLFDQALADARNEVDNEIELGIQVPIPKDMAGGYTHERHKRNFFILQLAGNIYQITNEEKYANYIKEALMAYARMYPTLPIHPTDRSYATGKIFWQCLNDANWLVYVSQAYDCIHDYLTPKERSYLEEDLFRPFADFLSVGNPQFFNRIHNHSTWANAAVGMIGLAMDDEELIQRALYGLPMKEDVDLSKDNDGGYIYEKGMVKAGFLAQLDGSFAPDGYFTEGPYYLRYAIFPFLIFSKALANNKPELGIMDYRDGILTKAIFALLNQTDANGEFFPLNDSQKGMSWKAREAITAVDILYHYDTRNKTLLDIAKKQNKVLIDDTGFAVALALKNGEEQKYTQQPMIYGDGKDGTEGGIAVLREESTVAVMKYSAQGMGHGHFDKLSYSLYDDTGEVLQDYGSARWVNVDQKGGGRYLKENKTFAKQSIAHNTVILGETSHYDGKIEKGEMYHPELFYSDLSDAKLQVISAKDMNAYEGTELHRTLILLSDEAFPKPLLVDVLRVESPVATTMDLPIWFMGHLLKANFEYKRELSTLSTLGTGHGYQHVWKEAEGKADGTFTQMNWFGNSKFYTASMVTEVGDELIFGRAGANDPEYNLRSDPVFIHRKENGTGEIFATIIESHGTYDPISEIPLHPYSSIRNIEIKRNDADYTVVTFSDDSANWLICLANSNASSSANHTLVVDKKELSWTGPFTLTKTKEKQ